MGKASLIDNFREWLAGIAFSIYLRLIRMSKEEFWAAQERDALRAIRRGGAGDALQRAAQALLDYRQRVGPLNFQLEKADDFLRELRLALEGEASEQ